MYDLSRIKDQDHTTNRITTRPPKATIAYAVSLTSCNAKFTLDGAAVLSHSIRLASYPTHPTSQYASKMIVFAHPDASECLDPFYKLGYDIRIKDVPIDVTQIKGDFLREHVIKSGCCGDKEFLKLYAYTLVEYPIVVHLDLDSLVVQPLDDLFDAMLDTNKKDLNVPVHFGVEIPQRIEAFFTRDYNMVNIGHKHPGVQGGFIIVRPNMEYFEEYKRVILEGNFNAGSGWGGEGYGGYYGAQQIQGLCSYFFDRLHPGTAVELNRCIYNSMNDSPYGTRRNTPNVEMCRDGKETCEDCRKRDFATIKSVHFTLCQKPWVCPMGVIKGGNLCRDFHKKWFDVRKSFEHSMDMTETNESANVNFHNDIFQGYCKGQGERNYVGIKLL